MKYPNFKRRRRIVRHRISLPKIKNLKELKKALEEHPDVLLYTYEETAGCVRTCQIDAELIEMGDGDLLIISDKKWASELITYYRPDHIGIDGTFKIIPRKMGRFIYKKSTQLITTCIKIHNHVSSFY